MVTQQKTVPTRSAASTPDEVPSSVDFVVVGAGAAGCVMAARLAKRTHSRVLLIEAGTSSGEDTDTLTPGAALAQLARPELSWNDVLVPQKGLNGRRLPLAQGRGLGGGSSLNLMAWFQGHPEDYAAWVSAGATGWDWGQMSTTFAEIENRYQDPSPQHRDGGPMTISVATDLHPISSAFVTAGHYLGLPVTDDFNGAHREGVGLGQANVHDGARHSVVAGYLRSAVEDDGLIVTTGALVRRVIMRGKRAVGVELQLDSGDRLTVDANLGVVLCAGAIRTPQLLMLSGIGNSEDLRSIHIEPRIHLPGVGANLSDHPMIYPTWRALDGAGLLTFAGTAETTEYELLRRGPLASLTQSVAMLCSEDSLSAPDLQMFLIRAGLDDNLAPLSEPAVSCGIALLTPQSRGSVRLASADPTEPPLIDPNFLTEPQDAVVLRRGLELAQKLFRSPDLAALTQGPISPQADLAGEDIADWIRQHAYSEWHPVGTARMGTDAQSVVDPASMRVHGTESLFVADASVMPVIPRGNTQAPTIAIAERAASRVAGTLSQVSFSGT